MNRYESARPGPREAGSGRVPRVLVVDDEADLRELLELTLVGMGLDVDCASDLRSARACLAKHRYALCLTDMRLPDGEGIRLVEQIVAETPETPVAVITAFGSADNAVTALKAGAFDYVFKPLGLDALRTLVRSALRVGQTPWAVRSASALEAGASVAQAEGGQNGAAVPVAPQALLLGVSPAIEGVRSTIARLARSMAPVAITGESGSGKELAARLIHNLSSRAHQPFIAVNCGAIPETLMESEFFGHRRGAFTGADQDRLGFFQAAHGGTLFLDEVADLPLAMQVKLLRVIQERRVRRIGAVTEDPVDVRIVSATHQDLARCVAAGRFRQDLFYRLQVIELSMPPLRSRREDIPILAEAVLSRLAARAGHTKMPRLTSVTLSYLSSYGFPGNVRELENILERALAFSDGETIRVEDLGLRPVDTEAEERELAEPLPKHEGRAESLGQLERQAAGARLAPDGVPECLPDYLDAVEREALMRALEATRHNRTAAARRLGISFRALRYRLQRLGIQ
jgi:two-component system response regulator PilR (NtrC family)